MFARIRSIIPVNIPRVFSLGFFLINEIITKNPFDRIRPIKRSDKKKEILLDDEIRALKRVAQNDPKKKAIVYILQATGVRVSECCRWNISDINFKTGEVTVYAQKTDSWRTLFLPKKVLRVLKKYLKTRTDSNPALFINRYGRRMSKASIQDALQTLGKRAKLEKHITVHLFRKTLATFLADSNMPSEQICYIMGHKQYSTTLRYYIQQSPNKVRESYLALAAKLP